MLIIRFSRVGKRNQPLFRIIVTDKKRASKAGRFVEEVGFYNPLLKQKTLKKDRIKYWLSVGAKPSPSIYNLLIEEKIIEDKKIPVHKKSKKKPEKQSPPETPAAVAEEKKETPPQAVPEKPPETVENKTKQIPEVKPEVPPKETPPAETQKAEETSKTE